MTPKPFSNIAVSLSGGGYRATTFHLGALSYLNHQTFNGKKILEEVKILSTISGGTFTGAMYALRLAQGKTFDDCFIDLYELLLNDQLVDLALHKLSKPGSWANPHKTKDLINAFSEVYNEVFFKGATFSVLYDGEKSHLTDVVFGSSEFTYGIQFRLQEEVGSGRFGNHYLNLPEAAAREIRIADAVAASSCFPGGFEPLIMPNDFGNGPDSKVDKAWQKKEDEGKFYPPTAIMDGGIVDNQGIIGVKYAEKRHSKNGDPFIGTYIVSDVAGEIMKPFTVPTLKEGTFKNSFTIRGINIALVSLLVIFTCLLAFLPMPADIFFITTIVASIIFTISALWFGIYFFIKSQLSAFIEEGFGADQLKEYLKDFRILIKTPVYILMYLVKFRALSVMKMVTDVFLRRIRSLSLESLYGSDEWNYRFKSNYIYTLKKDEKDLTEQMKTIVAAANNMPTTLWFTEKEIEDNVLNDLIACGQFTQCRNLIKYLDRIISGSSKESVFDNLDAAYQEDLGKLRDRMNADWEEFKVDPYWLVNKHLKTSRNENS